MHKDRKSTLRKAQIIHEKEAKNRFKSNLFLGFFISAKHIVLEKAKLRKARENHKLIYPLWDLTSKKKRENEDK